MKPQGFRLWAVSLFGLALWLFAIDLWLFQQRQEDFNEQATLVAYQLEALPIRMRAQGAGQLMGSISTRCRELAEGKLPPDAPEVIGILRLAAEMVSAESAFITDQTGTIVAYYIKQGASATGRSLKNRPYIQSALKGEPNMYAAIGGNTNDRGIYIAAPIKKEENIDGETVGVITLKISFELVDQLLGKQNGYFALMSPENTIFASNVPGSLFQLYTTDANLEELANNSRLGKYFTTRRPEKLTGPLTESSTLRLPVQWNDPYGPWTLLAQSNKHLGLSLTELFLCTFAYLILAAALLSNANIRRMRHQEKALSQSKLTAYVEQLEHASQRKSALAQMSLKLQQSDDIPSLGQAFFALAHHSLPIHQGALYTVDPAWPEQLIFAAGYGSSPDAGAPRVVSFGETLLGECAQNRELLQITAPPNGFWRIQCSDKALSPQELQFIPLIRDEHLLGVLEVASLNVFKDEERNFFDEMCVLLTMNLGILSHQTPPSVTPQGRM